MCHRDNINYINPPVLTDLERQYRIHAAMQMICRYAADKEYHDLLMLTAINISDMSSANADK